MRAHSHTREWGYDNEIKLLFFFLQYRTKKNGYEKWNWRAKCVKNGCVGYKKGKFTANISYVTFRLTYGGRIKLDKRLKHVLLIYSKLSSICCFCSIVDEQPAGYCIKNKIGPQMRTHKDGFNISQFYCIFYYPLIFEGFLYIAKYYIGNKKNCDTLLKSNLSINKESIKCVEYK